MKRMKPDERARIVKDHVDGLANKWLCMYGAWNQEKLLAALVAAVKARKKAAAVVPPPPAAPPPPNGLGCRSTP